MGTDITMFAERRTPYGWAVVGDIHNGDQDELIVRAAPIYDTRNSDLFVILGYNGGICVDLDSVDVIAPLRGQPPDVSPELHEWADGNCGAGWLLLSELLAFDWTGKRARREAMVSQRVAPLFADPNKPFPDDAWPSGEPTSYALWKRDGVVVQWTDTYADIAGEEFLAAIKRLATLGDPNDIRVVFWFDC